MPSTSVAPCSECVCFMSLRAVLWLAHEHVCILVAFSRIFLPIVSSQGRGDVECGVHTATHWQSYREKVVLVQQIVSCKTDQPSWWW